MMADILARRDTPFREIDRIRNEMNRLFSDSFGRFPLVEWHETGYPAIDIYGSNEEITLVAEVPGLKAEDIEISTTKDTITISGEFTQEQIPEQAEIVCRERNFGRFTRAFRLPVPVDADKANATIKDGLLVIQVPKAAELRPRTVKISAG